MKTTTKDKPRIHYTADYLISPQHPVTVNVVGVGGTGSQVLTSLARMNSALRALGHPGLWVRAIDPDRVTSANMGRQLFSPSDIGEHKCSVLVGRINRYFGTDWDSVPALFNTKSEIASANITISCVDTGKARRAIKAQLNTGAQGEPEEGRRSRYYQAERNPFNVPYYWLDFGNMQDRGQAVLGTVKVIRQPEDKDHKTMEWLPTVDQLFPAIFQDDPSDDQGPSCSLAEALDRQDLFINTNLANAGLGLLWKMFREVRIKYHGVFVNLETMQTNPINI